MATFLEQLFNYDKKRLKAVEKKAREVDALAASMAALSDDQLKAKTPEFRQRQAEGATLDDLLPEAYAVARDAAKLVIGE